MKLLHAAPSKPHQWFIPVLVSLIALICFIFESHLFGSLGYSHMAISEGQVWRLLSGHFFHANDNHLIMNLMGLWCLWLLHGDYYHYRNMAALYLISAITTGLGMFYFDPDVEIYVGLSGILHGVLIWGALKDIQHKYNMGYLLLFATIGKIGFEQYFGASDEVVKLIEMNVAVNAHLFGAIGGVLAYLLDVKNKTDANKKAT
ncbi:rhombosortase [Thalassotalea sp. LPB0316]|uniref:rhombosortase n=1 Tax=Thalassotalea sp. LPB0316 TaxID=2769490 RepID=UPI001867C628|nr:rhombosortase [Thalassotalea sp. LPB0316]QOL24723.1 rhombosortase [Thalassotalea sp. LPB0316]